MGTKRKIAIVAMTAVAASAVWNKAEAKLWINEIMQSNIDGVYTAGDFPDSWFEIYNDGESAVRLTNYRVGDSDDFESAYELTGSVGVGAKGYNLIYCDKEGSGYHTDFRIDSGKGKLYLFSPEGEILDMVSYAKMPAPNVAYGRVEDGGAEWGWELTPTPRAANGGGVTTKILPDPEFTTTGNVRYNVKRIEEVTVRIPAGVELPSDTRLYVTTDGSEPTTESASYEQEFKASTSQSMVIRAKLISKEAISPRAVTHSYIYHPRAEGLPVVSLVTNQDYLYDEEIGIWQHFNEKWRRPVNVEYFTKSGGDAEINQLGEFRIHGGWSRNHPQKSFAVYANKRFGTKRYDYAFWEDKPEVKKSKSFVLRNGGNCFNTSRINDAFVQTLFGRNCANLDWQAYQPTVCYINGEYRGIYALRQRSNEDYVEDCYDGLEDIDMLENWNELKAGTTDSFEELKRLYESNPSYEQMAEAIDVENFANLYIANAWATNTDFPGNNIVMWRPTAEGGKWRWIMKDLDFLASNPSDFTYFDFLLHTGGYENNVGEGNAHHAVKLFQVMTGLEEFREAMIDRFMVYLGDFLRPEVTAALIEEQREALMAEYRAHLSCYGNPVSYEGWMASVDGLKQWCAERTDRMPGIICDYFGLGAPVKLSISGGGSGFSVNGIAVQGEDYAGAWPAMRSVTVRSDDENMGWKVTVVAKTGRRNVYEVASPEYIITPSKNVASIEIEGGDVSGVGNVVAEDAGKVKVTPCGGMIVVEGTAELSRIRVSDMSGRIVAETTPKAPRGNVEVKGRGVYVVEVEMRDGLRDVRKVVVGER